MTRRKRPQAASKKADGRPWEVDADAKPVLQDHHITPKSRGGDHGPKNILQDVPSNLHWAWHQLFGNLKPLEIIDVILRIFFRGGEFNGKYQRIVKKRSRGPQVSPDEIVTLLVEEVFPEDWTPSVELLEMLITRFYDSTQGKLKTST